MRARERDNDSFRSQCLCPQTTSTFDCPSHIAWRRSLVIGQPPIHAVAARMRSSHCFHRWQAIRAAVYVETLRMQYQYQSFAPSECGERQPDDGQITRGEPLEYSIDGAIIEMHQSLAATNGIQKRCVFGMGSPSRTESHAQPLLTVGDHSNMAPRSSSGADGYPIRKTCDLRIFPIEMILNKYFLEETPGNESKRTIPTDTGNPHSYASPLPATVMGSSRERRMRRKKLYSRKRKEMHCVCCVWCVCLCSAQRLHNLAGSGSGCIVFRSGSRVSSYLLGLLAKIKCSISSSQPDL